MENGITPIIDLIHYGTPIWMDNGVLNNWFPERFAEYAHQFAKRFDGIEDHYTPMNEPQGSANESGQDAVWPPYLIGVDGCCTICLALAKAIVLTSRALRDTNSNCCLISSECNSLIPYETLATVAGLPDLDLGSTFPHRLFPASLAYGMILTEDPLVQALSRMGYADDDFQWFLEHAEPPDILGYNLYPALTPGATTLVEARDRLLRDLTEVHAATGLPVYVTETSAGLNDEEKVEWIRALGELCRQARGQGLALRGINWWPLFETIQWDYRDNGKSVVECIRPGGWNNGLYVINKGPATSLERIPTGAVDEFRTLCADVLKDTE